MRSPEKRGSRQLPPKIGSALASINVAPLFRDLSPSARIVLSYLVKVTDAKDPQKPSWPFKETMAIELNLGEATIYRMLNVLIKHGLVERLQQERKSRNGRFAVARLRLTAECCAGLGLIVRNNSSEHKTSNVNAVENIDTENNVDAKSASICIAAAPKKPADSTADFVATPQAEAASPNIKMIDGHIDILPTADQQTQSSKQSRPAGWQKPAPGQHYLRVPREFFWLIDEDRLTAPQTCKLMREFSSRGQRLGDAVSALAKRLREIPKAKTYAYLASLAKGQTDFAWLRKEQSRTETETRKKAIVREKTEDLQAMTGKYLFSGNKTHLFLIRGGHAEAWWLDNGVMRRGTQPINADFVEAFTKGRLAEIGNDQAAETLALWGRLN